MATNIIRTGSSSFFLNDDGSISVMYDPWFNKVFMMALNDGTTKVPIKMEDISVQTGGQIVFKFDNQKYIIEDGFRNRLIMAGYIYAPEITEEDEVTEDKKVEIKNAIWSSFSNIVFDGLSISNMIRIESEVSGYKITIEIEPINRMIDRNLKRAENSLPLYPTERGMIKFSSLYFRVYAQRHFNTRLPKSYEELHHICNKMLRSIIGAKTLDKTKISSILGVEKFKYMMKECHIKGTILKWEEDL